MFIKLSVTHTHHPSFGFALQDETQEHINFNSVIRFYRKKSSDITTVQFQDGRIIGVKETPDEIDNKLQ